MQPGAGQQVVLLAAPGTGKTMLALNWAARTGTRTLYCSADTDARLMTEQLGALATGHSRPTVKQRLTQSVEWRGLYAQAIQQKFPNLILDFDSSPRLEDVGEQAEALTELWGEPPGLIVIDTATHIRKPNRDWGGWEETWQRCSDLAAFFGSVVMLPHHLNKGGEGSMNPDRLAEVVLKLTGQAGLMTVEVVKNRGGKAHFQIHLEADYEHARIDERTGSGG